MYAQLQDVEWLEKQYVINYRTLQSIADEVGCNKTTVQRALKRHDIKRRKRTVKYRLLSDRDWLFNAYVVEKRSLKDIAKEVNSSPGNVGEHLRQFGIQTRTIKEALDLANPPDQRFGENAANWKGGRRIFNGYVFIYAPWHPHTAKGKPYVQEHRLVMEDQLGRYLEPHEIVHHKDGNKLNNDPDNLVVKTRGKHVSEHFKASHEVLMWRQKFEELENRVSQLEAEIERLKNDCSGNP